MASTFRGSRSWTRVTSAVVGGLLCVGCGSPDASGFREQTRLAVGAALSETRTVEEVLLASSDQKAPGGYASTVVGRSADALTSARDDYESLFPPPSQDRLSARTTALLGRAARQVGAAELALHRSDAAGYRALARRLERTARRLEALDRELG